jgi:hypothetical protein
VRYFQKVKPSSYKVHDILVGFLMKLTFSRLVFKNAKISNFFNICPVGVEFFHADRDRQTDRQTDRRGERETDVHDEANSRSSQICKRA